MKYFLFIIWLLNCLTYAHAQQTINDLTVKDLKVVSTTKGSKPCPLMTQTQRDAIASPLNGQCVYNTTTSKLNVYNGSIWKAAGGGVDAWLTATAYAVGDLVIQSNKIYQCLIAHTSGTFATDLAASRWVEISSPDLTGPISSSLGVTSVTSQTGTGSTFVMQNTPTLTTPNIGVASGSSLSLTGNANIGTSNTVPSYIGVASNNSLFSGLWFTASSPTTSNYTFLFGSSNTFINSASGLIQFRISNNTRFTTGNSGAGVFLANDTAPTNPFEVKVASGGATALVVKSSGNVGVGTDTPNANAVLDVQSTTKAAMMPRMTTAQKNAISSPTAGMEVYDSDLNIKQFYNGTQWITSTSIQLENELTAKVAATTGVVSDLNKSGWLTGSCTYSSGTWSCPVASNVFTVIPNCVANADGAGPRIVNYQKGSSTTTSVKFLSQVTTSGSNVDDIGFTIKCSKTGVDYQSTDAYIASNGNYDWTSYTPAIGGFGTVSGLSAFHRRIGGDLEIKVSFTEGTVASSLASITLPGSLTIDAARMTLASTTASASPIVGTYGDTNGGGGGFAVASTSTSTSTIYFGNVFGNTATTTITPRNGDIIGTTGGTFTALIKVPITGWTNSNLTVASLQGTPNIPGLTTAVDTFSVNYGTTNISTSCSSSPCFVDQIGTAVSSITRSGTGAYTLNTARTYSKLKCVFTGGSIVSGSTSSCANCSALLFATTLDSFGVLMCQGSY